MRTIQESSSCHPENLSIPAKSCGELGGLELSNQVAAFEHLIDAGAVLDAAREGGRLSRHSGIIKHRVEGNPDRKHVSTSYAVRQNLTMRMSMRRFTRLTNAFSKKAENHVHALALYFTFYNFVRQHKTLRCSPAMAAGLLKTLWSMEDVVALIDAQAEPAKKRGQYKARAKAA